MWVASLVTALLVTGCAGIEPYEPRDYRQEGLERGLYTGSEGEFVIYRKSDEPEAINKSDIKTDREQQKMDREEKKKEKVRR